jgi:hypothetical protein
MQVRLWDGSMLEGRLITDHPRSKEGHPVLVVGEEVYSPDDVSEVVSASEAEIRNAGPEWGAIWGAAPRPSPVEWDASWRAGPRPSPVQWFAHRIGCWIVLALALAKALHALLTHRPWE